MHTARRAKMALGLSSLPFIILLSMGTLLLSYTLLFRMSKFSSHFIHCHLLILKSLRGFLFALFYLSSCNRLLRANAIRKMRLVVRL